MDKERTLAADYLSAESRSIYKNIIDIAKSDDRFLVNRSEVASPETFVAGGGWVIECSFLETPVLIGSCNEAFPIAVIFSADSSDDISHGDYVKDKIVKILGVEPNKGLFKKNFEDESCDTGNLKDVDMLRFYFFGGKAGESQEKSETGDFNKMKDKVNISRVYLETIIGVVGPYSSDSYMDVTRYSAPKRCDWEQYKGHPCSWGKEKRRKSRK